MIKRSLLVLAVFFILSGMITAVVSASSDKEWTEHPMGVLERLYDVSYGNGKFVAAGGGGMLLTSEDGQSWSKYQLIPFVEFRGVTYGDQFVVVGADSVIMTSVDGLAWTKHVSADIEHELIGVSYGKGTYVAVGISGTIMTSLDGLTWASQASGTTNNLNAVSYDGVGMFVAVGENGTILTSANGETWTDRTSTDMTAVLYDVSYGHDLYVAVGAGGMTVSSHDGITWTGVYSGRDDHLYGVSYNHGVYVATGKNATILYSNDGVMWTRQIVPDIYDEFRSVVHGNGVVVVVGSAGMLLHKEDPSYSVTYDGNGNTGGSVPVDGAAYSEYASVTVSGNTGVLGKTGYIFEGWNTAPDGSGTNYPAGAKFDMGATNVTLYANWLIIPDWTKRDSGTVEDLYGISYGNGQFVGVGVN